MPPALPPTSAPAAAGFVTLTEREPFPVAVVAPRGFQSRFPFRNGAGSVVGHVWFGASIVSFRVRYDDGTEANVPCAYAHSLGETGNVVLLPQRPRITQPSQITGGAA